MSTDMHSAVQAGGTNPLLPYAHGMLLNPVLRRPCLYARAGCYCKRLQLLCCFLLHMLACLAIPVVMYVISPEDPAVVGGGR